MATYYPLFVGEKPWTSQENGPLNAALGGRLLYAWP